MLEAIMLLLVGFFTGSTVILTVAYYIDSRSEKVVMREAQILAELMRKYDVDAETAQDIHKKINQTG